MAKPFYQVITIWFSFLLVFSCSQKEKQNETSALKQYQIPHLAQKGNTTQLIVDDQPFIIFGGELGNSSFTSVEYMKPIWPKLKAMNLNTVLVPVYWELIEPEEGVFDFALMDELINQAHQNNLRLVLLWFASWKNSQSEIFKARL